MRLPYLIIRAVAVGVLLLLVRMAATNRGELEVLEPLRLFQALLLHMPVVVVGPS